MVSKRIPSLRSPRAIAAIDRIGNALRVSSSWVKDQSDQRRTSNHEITRSDSMSETEKLRACYHHQFFPDEINTEEKPSITVAPVISVSLDSPKDSSDGLAKVKPSRRTTRRGNGRWWAIYSKNSGTQLTRAATSPELGRHRTCRTPKSALSTSACFRPRETTSRKPKRVHFPKSPRRLTRVRALPMSDEDVEARKGPPQAARSRSASYPPDPSSREYQDNLDSEEDHTIADDEFEGPVPPQAMAEFLAKKGAPPAPPRPERTDRHTCHKEHRHRLSRHKSSLGIPRREAPPRPVEEVGSFTSEALNAHQHRHSHNSCSKQQSSGTHSSSGAEQLPTDSQNSSYVKCSRDRTKNMHRRTGHSNSRGTEIDDAFETVNHHEVSSIHHHHHTKQHGSCRSRQGHRASKPSTDGHVLGGPAAPAQNRFLTIQPASVGRHGYVKQTEDSIVSGLSPTVRCSRRRRQQHGHIVHGCKGDDSRASPTYMRSRQFWQ